MNKPDTSISVLDVAAYILERQGEMTTMKLQKLVYYCQAWSLVWDEQELFTEEIQAWANGPVVRRLYDFQVGRYKISEVSDGDPAKLSKTQRETVDAVLKYYGDKPSQWLSDLTHAEDPWKNARTGLPAGVRSETVISHAAMMEYYSSLG